MADKKIIALSGKQYCGKDTVAKLIIEKFPNFKRIGIGDAIKLEYGRQKGLSFDEIELNKHLYRADLIELGNWGRSCDPLFWLKEIVKLDYDIIVPDMRVIAELDVFKSENAFLLRIEATKESRILRGKITNEEDITECDLDHYSGWSYVLDNSHGLKELKCSCVDLFSAIENYFFL